MKAVFPGYYTPTQEEFDLLWTECLFIFDTNALLNLYRYNKESRELLFKVMDTIADRIWIPHQIALEYHKHMLIEIYNQKNEYNSISDKVTKFVTSLKSELSELRHSNINGERINEFLEDFEQKIKTELKLQEESQPDLDLIKKKINALFTEKIGPEYTQDELNEIYEDGVKRFENKIPPGYKDAKDKEGKITYNNGLEYKDMFGDLIYWRQILDKSTDELVKSVILITDDKKNDWVLTIKGQKKGPHPELINEFRRESNNKLFYLYNTEQFLEQAKKYFGKVINNDEDIEKAIENVRNTKKYSQKDSIIKFAGLDEQTKENLVKKYLNSLDTQKQNESLIERFTKSHIDNDSLEFKYDVLAQLKSDIQDRSNIASHFALDLFSSVGIHPKVSAVRFNDYFVTFSFKLDTLLDTDVLQRNLNEVNFLKSDKSIFKIEVLKIKVVSSDGTEFS